MDREWLVSICLKYILVFLLPVYLMVGEHSTYMSVLLTLGPGGGSFQYYSQHSRSLALPALILILTLPAVLFDYTVHHRSGERSVTKLFILVLILLNPIIQILLLMPIMAILPAVLAPNYELYSLISESAIYAVMTGIWALPLMVVIPYFMRQANDLRPERRTSDKGTIPSLAHVLTRYDLLAVFMAISLFMMPILVIDPTPFFSAYSSDIQDLVMIAGGSILQVTRNLNHLSLEFTTVDTTYFVFFPIAASFYFLYVHDVFEYLKKRTSRARCITTGIAGTLGSLVVYYGFSMLYPYGGLAAAYPLPIIFVVGLIVMLKMKRLEVREKIWDE